MSPKCFCAPQSGWSLPETAHTRSLTHSLTVKDPCLDFSIDLSQGLQAATSQVPPGGTDSRESSIRGWNSLSCQHLQLSQQLPGQKMLAGKAAEARVGGGEFLPPTLLSWLFNQELAGKLQPVIPAWSQQRRPGRDPSPQMVGRSGREQF